ncbi:MAG: histidine phosphatase family protein [Oscillospiraceae bacterium]|nr:histidine phosphatase family protein [Oscillospiraceae bacterium]
MKILIIRHGDPDYEHDSLTEKGKREAELLAKRLINEKIDYYYLSPLGRAQATAEYTLKAKNAHGETCPWLREFHAPVIDELTGEERIPWDQLPAVWTAHEEYYSSELWHTTPTMKSGNVIAEAERVYKGIDEIIERHGYRREGNIYRAVSPNRDVIALFCHFGVECVMLGHLLGISPVVLWQGFCAAPTSVTVLTTEERREGIACFRMNAFGDTGHLYAEGEPPAFAARFCEIYDSDERHD